MSHGPTFRDAAARGCSSAAIDALGDADLLSMEARLRERFFAHRRREPALLDTTWREFRGSAELLEAWTRWLRASRVVDLRGLHDARPPLR